MSSAHSQVTFPDHVGVLIVMAGCNAVVLRIDKIYLANTGNGDPDVSS